MCFFLENCCLFAFNDVGEKILMTSYTFAKKNFGHPFSISLVIDLLLVLLYKSSSSLTLILVVLA